MATERAKRLTEHPIDRPPDTDPQQGHEHPEADPPVRQSQQSKEHEVGEAVGQAVGQGAVESAPYRPVSARPRHSRLA